MTGWYVKVCKQHMLTVQHEMHSVQQHLTGKFVRCMSQEGRSISDAYTSHKLSRPVISIGVMIGGVVWS